MRAVLHSDAWVSSEVGGATGSFCPVRWFCGNRVTLRYALAETNDQRSSRKKRHVLRLRDHAHSILGGYMGISAQLDSQGPFSAESIKDVNYESYTTHTPNRARLDDIRLLP